MNQLVELLELVAQKLKKSKQQLVTAESCTGGLIASYITEIPGSSHWFERGFVTYSNLAKEQMLGVSKQLITQFGAVSEEVALAMAEGALKHSAADIAVSVTGIAGPDGGSLEKPVGTVCFAWAMHGVPAKSLRKQFHGTRQEIRIASCIEAFKGIFSLI